MLSQILSNLRAFTTRKWIKSNNFLNNFYFSANLGAKKNTENEDDYSEFSEPPRDVRKTIDTPVYVFILNKILLDITENYIPKLFHNLEICNQLEHLPMLWWKCLRRGIVQKRALQRVMAIRSNILRCYIVKRVTLEIMVLIRYFYLPVFSKINKISNQFTYMYSHKKFSAFVSCLQIYCKIMDKYRNRFVRFFHKILFNHSQNIFFSRIFKLWIKLKIHII